MKEKESKPVDDYVYQIFLGEKLEELYTFCLPILEPDFTVIIEGLLKKGIVSQTVLNNKIEEFYKEEQGSNINSFSLRDGFSVKVLDKKNLTWLNTTKEQAEILLKDKVLVFYQNLVPDLVGNLKNLQEQVQSLQTRRTSLQYEEEEEEEEVRPNRQQPQRRGLKQID